MVPADHMKRIFHLSALLKTTLLLLPAVALLAGCQTSTIESRRAQRAAGYAALLPEQQQLVDKGQIKSGMTEDAVYIAWGPAWQILRGETEGKATTTWIYRGTWWDEQTYWSYREVHQNGRYHSVPFLDRTSVPRDYVMAEVVFVEGVVRSWKTLPRPNL